MRGLSPDSSTFKGSNMGGKVFVTYKRKRLFSRGDQSQIDFYSGAHREIFASQSSANLDENEKPASEHTLPNKETSIEMQHEYSKTNGGENMLQCENCDAQCRGQCSEEHSAKLLKLDPCYTKQQDSLILERNAMDQEMIPQEDSDGKQITFNPNVVMEGDSRETCRTDSAAQSNGERKSSDAQFNPEGKSCDAQFNAEGKLCDAQSKPLILESGSEYECEEKVPISSSPNACAVMESDMICSGMSDEFSFSCQVETCISGAFIGEEMNKRPKVHDGGFCSDALIYCKWSAALLTYQRRSKRKKDITAAPIASENPGTMCASKMQLDGNPLIAPMDEKSQKPPKDIDNPSASPLPAPEIPMTVQMEDPLHFPEGTAKCPQDPSAAAASRDIDCNKRFDSDLNEKHPPGPSEVLPVTLGLASKSNENMQTAQVNRRDNDSPAMTAAVNKGKSVVDYSPPEAAGGSLKNKYLQLFPENSSKGVPQLANDREQLRINPQACYYPSYPWPGVQVHPREPFHNFLLPTPDQAESFSRQKMMLDNMLNRARAARGNRSIFPDILPAPTRWSEEELDCLWIGVRRHGRGNWDAMLRDRRLQFSPWKTPRDLAEKWQEEQSRLFQSMPVPQVNYPNPFALEHANNLLLHPQANGQADAAQLSLGNAYGVPNRHFYNLINVPNMQYSQPHQELPRNIGPLYVLRDESSTGKGHLPHWLRDAAVPPPTLWVNQLNPEFNPGSSQQPFPDNHRYPSSTERRSEPQNGGGKARRTNPPLVVNRARNETREHKVSNPEEDLIVIPSDASSEETISDDRTKRS